MSESLSSKQIADQQRVAELQEKFEQARALYLETLNRAVLAERRVAELEESRRRYMDLYGKEREQTHRMMMERLSPPPSDVQRDAERYRFLRQRLLSFSLTTGRLDSNTTNYGMVEDSEHVDRLVDLEMRRHAETKEERCDVCYHTREYHEQLGTNASHAFRPAVEKNEAPVANPAADARECAGSSDSGPINAGSTPAGGSTEISKSGAPAQSGKGGLSLRGEPIAAQAPADETPASQGHKDWCNAGRVGSDGLWMKCNCGHSASET